MHRWGVTVDSASSAQDARALKGRWDVILADYQLGADETGLDFLSSMHATGASLALVTANSTDELLNRASLLEVEVIRKPVAPASLRAFLARAAAARAQP